MIDGEGPIRLNTHCRIWLQSGQLDQFSRSACRSGFWINMDCLEWVRRALETPGLSLVPITSEIAVESTRLPGNMHADPADRILVATARNLGARLMTRDQALLDYGRKRHGRIVSA